MVNTDMDIVKLDVPLFIRLLELAREDIKNDADIHDLAQRVVELSQKDVQNTSIRWLIMKIAEIIRSIKYLTKYFT
jgi:hypothetical protein